MPGWRRLTLRGRRAAGLRHPDRAVSRAPFSLFEGDLVNRLFGALGLGGRRPAHLALRSLLLVAITWLPMALVAPSEGLASLEVSGRNFFADFAAYAQFLVGLPLFVVAESVVARATRSAAQQFLLADIVRPADQPGVYAVHARIAALRRSPLSDVVCLAIAAVLTWFIWHAEMGFPADKLTWHTTVLDGHRVLTRAGAWEFFVALPIQMYWWLRIIWKIGLWYLYLRAVSALRLDLRPSHPDGTGGIGFVSAAQARFSLVILAYGISNVAATIGYKIAIEGADLTIPPVWGPIVGFSVLAPTLFLAPLLRFTHQLRVARDRALRRYGELAMNQVRQTEQLLAQTDTREKAADLKSAFFESVNVWKMYEQTNAMRVVPFDLRSAGQLIGSTFGSMATLLPLLRVEGALPKWMEFVSKLFQLLGSHHGG
jgi:hypothetical protein